MKTSETSQTEGWTPAVLEIHKTFRKNARLLMVLVKLSVISYVRYLLIQKDFEQNTWQKLRDGE